MTEIDTGLLRSILSNVLANSLRYARSDRQIRFQLTANRNWIILTIADRGIGIAAEDLPKIFEPFHRGKNVSNIPGTGLGLNIVKRFIELLGGKIDVFSRINRGTKVTIQIPLK